MWRARSIFIFLTVIHTLLLSSEKVQALIVSKPWNFITNSINSVKNGVGNIATGVVKDTKQNIDNQIENIKQSQPAQFMNDQIEAAQNFEHVKQIGNQVQNVYNNIGPSAFLDKIQIPVENATEMVSSLVQTTAVFHRLGATLNCFGLPVNSIINSFLENIFMQKTEAEKVKFYIHTNRSSTNMFAKDPFNFLDFDVRRPTVLMVHGFMSAGTEPWLNDMKNAYLKLRDVNAIIVDWQQGSNTWNYFSAAVNTRIVGLEIAKLFAKIRDLNVNEVDIKEWGEIHFVGHSLGSHISAHAAYLIKESQRDQSKQWIVSRITGLDPAQPCFSTADDTLKLDKTDATFVDIIHTNARNLLLLGLGLPDQLGHVDFYPNGGKAQPGCSDVNASFWNFPVVPFDIIKESVCSHGRSHAFFTESILDMAAGNCTFHAFRWDQQIQNDSRSIREECMVHDCAGMGEISEKYPVSGMFYAPTRNTAPYCEMDINAPMTSQDPELSNPNAFTELVKKLEWLRY